MTERHLTREMLMEAHRADSPSGWLAQLVIAHVYRLCPHCRSEFDSWREEVSAGLERAQDYTQAFDNAVEKARRRHSWLAAEDRGAEERLKELTALPLARAVEAVETIPERFRGSLLAELLIEESRECLPGEPRRSYVLAQLAQRVLEHSTSSAFGQELYARAVAYAANALRAQGELRGASELFGHAHFVLRALGVADRATRAELDHLEGSLRLDQRRLRAAERLLERSVRGYRIERADTGQANALLTLAMLHREKGDMTRAIEITRSAQALIKPRSRLYLYANHNLATWLCEAGEYRAAREHLATTLEAHQRYAHPPTQLRLAWVEAKIARGLGETGVADEGFRSVRDGFLREGNAYDAALVSLELATMYAEQGRTGEVKALAEDIVPVFEAQEVHRETLAALILFRDAARAEKVTLAFLQELATYLERARLDPAQPFRHP